MSDEPGGSQDDFVFLSNRGSRIFEQALMPLGGRPYHQGDSHIDLLYFDRYGGKLPPSEPTVGFTLIDRRLTIPLDHKAQMARALIDAGLNYPRVYFNEEDVPDEPGSLWFVKNPLATAGKGIAVVSREEIGSRFEPGYIIQEAIEDLALIDGKKFTLRVYLLVNRGTLYLFPAGFVVLHGSSYCRGSTDPGVQFDHAGYMKENDPVSLVPYRSCQDFSGRQTVMQNLRPHMVAVFSAFSELLKHEKAHTYCVFGVDLLVRDDLQTVLVEINDRPNFVHTRAINQAVNIPMVQALCCVLNPVKQACLPAAAVKFEQLAEL